MNWKYLLLIGIILILGCVQPQEHKKQEIPKFSGVYLEIWGERSLTLAKGEPFQVDVRIINKGDLVANISKVYLEGDILYLNGELSREMNEYSVLPGSYTIVSFSGLSVSDFFGGNTVKIYPSVCYDYETKVQFMTYFSAVNDIYESLLRQYPNLDVDYNTAPVIPKISGPSVVRLYYDPENGTYQRSIYYKVYFTAESLEGWPVMDCDNLGDARLKNLTIYIYVTPNKFLKEDFDNGTFNISATFDDILCELETELETEKIGNKTINYTTIKDIKCNIPSEKLIYLTRYAKTRTYNLWIKITSKEPIKSGNIRVDMDADYYYYRTFKDETVVINVVS